MTSWHRHTRGTGGFVPRTWRFHVHEAQANSNDRQLDLSPSETRRMTQAKGVALPTALAAPCFRSKPSRESVQLFFGRFFARLAFVFSWVRNRPPGTPSESASGVAATPHPRAGAAASAAAASGGRREQHVEGRRDARAVARRRRCPRTFRGFVSRSSQVPRFISLHTDDAPAADEVATKKAQKSTRVQLLNQSINRLVDQLPAAFLTAIDCSVVTGR